MTRLTRSRRGVPDEYSLYEARPDCRRSYVRFARDGRWSSPCTDPGRRAAPVDPSVRPQTLEERLAELDARGAIVAARRSPGDANAFPIGPWTRGALKRFLEERD
ncbi:MAG TPA: hypothetical protein VLE53_11395 [Gemmatimonadaceae bacterium]|nr:hypothetical protein [Gemmatimonadaceae bacterium]